MTEMNKAIGIAEGDKARPDVLQRILVRRAEIELALGRPADARADAERSIRLGIPNRAPDAHSAYLGMAYLAQGRALLALGSTEEAAHALSAAVEELRPTFGADHAQTRLAERLLAQPTGGKRS